MTERPELVVVRDADTLAGLVAQRLLRTLADAQAQGRVPAADPERNRSRISFAQAGSSIVAVVVIGFPWRARPARGAEAR